jgi:hypothetical protein
VASEDKKREEEVAHVAIRNAFRAKARKSRRSHREEQAPRRTLVESSWLGVFPDPWRRPACGRSDEK